MIRSSLIGLGLLACVQPAFASDTSRSALDALIARHASANGVPAALVHRVVVRESRYNPRAVGRGGAMGLMQIKHGTARALGYQGAPAGLLDADTNLTYAVKYLAGAYRVADGNADRAVAYYASGYYYVAKRRAAAAVANETSATRRVSRTAAKKPEPAAAAVAAATAAAAAPAAAVATAPQADEAPEAEAENLTPTTAVTAFSADFAH